MNIFKSLLRKDSHEAFTATISTKTPTELVVIRRNLLASNATNKEAKVRLLDKKIAIAKGFRGA